MNTDELQLPAGSGESEDHRAHRKRKMLLAMGSNILIRPLSALFPLIVVPLFLRYLGTERYGLFESVTAMAMYFGLTNLGLGIGLMNKLTGSMVSGDRDEAKRYVSSLTVALLGISVTGVILASVIIPLVDWSHVLKTDDPTGIRELPWAIWLAAAAMLGAQVPSIAWSVYTAFQELHRANVWDGVSRILCLATCAAVVYWTHWGLVGAVAAALGTPVLVRLVNAVLLLYWEKPWLAPSLSHFDWKLLKETASEGIQLCVLQAATMLLFQTDKLVIAYFLGSQNVTSYAVLGRVFTVAYGFYMIFLGPLWPATGEAIRRGDREWVLKALGMASRTGFILMCGTGVALLIGGNFAFRILEKVTHQSGLEVSRSLIIAVALTFASRAWIDCRSVVLNAAGVLKPQFKIYVTHSVLNLLAAAIAAPIWGVEGVAWCIPITGVFTSFVGYTVLIRKLSRGTQVSPEAVLVN